MMSGKVRTQEPLADRIAAALSAEATSAEISDLISEAERAAKAAAEDHHNARASALDPTAGTEAVIG